MDAATENDDNARGMSLALSRAQLSGQYCYFCFQNSGTNWSLDVVLGYGITSELSKDKEQKNHKTI
jgi:hypothetical protein